MSNHRSKEYKNNYPNKCNGNKHIGDSTLTCRENVGQDSGYYYEEGQGRKRITRRNIYILETTLTVEECGQTPVGDGPKRYGNHDRQKLCEYGAVVTSGVKGVALTNGLVKERENSKTDNSGCRSYRTALLVLKIPESIEWMERKMECIEQLLKIGLLTNLKSGRLILSTCPAKELNE